MRRLLRTLFSRKDKVYKKPVEMEGVSQWRLAWRRFRRHRVGRIGGAIVLFLFLVLVFAEFIAPYRHTQTRSGFTYAPPTRIRIFDEEGRLSRPFVYATERTLDRATWSYVYTEDTSVKYPIRFFIRGEPYRLFGFIPTNVRLFGVDAPVRVHLFGTDEMGRDLFSRIVMGTRVSLLVGPFVVLLSLPLAILMGGASGYYGGGIDMFMQRVFEVIMSIPALPFWLALGTALPRDWSPEMRFFGIVAVMSAIGWAGTARIIRGMVLSIRAMDFTEAARAVGARDLRIIGRHIVPNLTSYLIVSTTLTIPGAILGESGLSFLGIGIHEPMVSWGLLLSKATNAATIESYPWILIPGIFITVAVLAFNFLGDAMRDAFDPFKVL